MVPTCELTIHSLAQSIDYTREVTIQAYEMVIIVGFMDIFLGPFDLLLLRGSSYVPFTGWVLVVLFKHGTAVRTMLEDVDEAAPDIRLLLKAVLLSSIVTVVYDISRSNS
jgi:hypothetical protein